MNTPTKLTVSRLILSIIMIIILIFPFYSVGVNFPKYMVEGIKIDSRYIIAGIIFIIASFTDFLDGYLARKNNQITNLGKMLDAIADKVLVNPALIILAVQGFIPVVVPVVIITRDIIVDAIKMEASSKGHVVAAIGSGKLKTVVMMVGLILTFFYNLPFELINIRVSLILILFATVLSVISLVEYFNINKKYIFENIEKLN